MHTHNRAASVASAHVPPPEFTMTAMAHYHVVKEKSRHTQKKKRKKGSKERSSHKTGDFLFAFFYMTL
jgi:hypothetical protein